ncbi:MAG TPA: NmrA family protein, partial [Kribbella sp.]
MTTTPILILGGKGKTGRRVVEQLTARQVPVRLASRSSEQRFDWYDDTTWSAAIDGIDTAYLA